MLHIKTYLFSPLSQILSVKISFQNKKCLRHCFNKLAFPHFNSTLLEVKIKKGHLNKKKTNTFPSYK